MDFGLPNELWYEIFSYVIKRDLKNVRLVGKGYMADFATSLLFDTAYIAARKGVMDAFKGLVNHPILRRHVKRLVYDSSWIEPKLTGSSWNGPQIPGSLINDMEGAVQTVYEDTQLALAFALQEDIQTREIRPALKSALKNFPNLEKFHYADMARTAGLPGDTWTPYSDATEAHMRDPRVHGILSRKFSKFVAFCCTANTCRGKHSKFFRRQYGGLWTLLELMNKYYHLASFSELSLGSGLHSMGNEYAGIPNFFFYKNSGTFPALQHMFTCLRKLDLTICFTNERTVSDSALWEGLWQLLVSAKVLEELSLSGQIHPERVLLDLDESWPDEAVGSLHILRLRACKASADRLSNMVWCNKLTLRRLELNELDLETGTKSWPSVTNFFSKQVPGVTVDYGFTLRNGQVCNIMKPKDGDSDNDILESRNDEQSEDGDSTYSEGENFVLENRVVGFRRKAKLTGGSLSQADESEYEDEIEVVKTLQENGDYETDYDSDEVEIEDEDEDMEPSSEDDNVSL